jgi:phosphatidylglycerophosphatase A
MSSLSQRFILFLATGGGSGYFPVMPGTAGSAVGVAVFFVLSPLPLFLYIVTSVSFIFLSIWSADRAVPLCKTKSQENKDPSHIVIDEIAGYLVTMISFPFQWWYALGGFIIFRAMDIIKPYPADIIDSTTKGGVGIVLDDVIAGVYANIILQVIRLFI